AAVDDLRGVEHRFQGIVPAARDRALEPRHLDQIDANPQDHGPFVGSEGPPSRAGDLAGEIFIITSVPGEGPARRRGGWHAGARGLLGDRRARYALVSIRPSLRPGFPTTTEDPPRRGSPTARRGPGASRTFSETVMREIAEFRNEPLTDFGKSEHRRAME